MMIMMHQAARIGARAVTRRLRALETALAEIEGGRVERSRDAVRLMVAGWRRRLDARLRWPLDWLRGRRR